MKTTTLLLFILFTCEAFAQNPILNQSFENWNAGNPDNWVVNNSNFPPTPLIPLTQVTDAYAGSSALKGEVISVQGNAFPPTIYSAPSGTQSGFPVTQAHASMSFYYKFSPAVAGDLIYAYIIASNINSTAIGAGSGSFADATNIYTQGEVPISYFESNPTNLDVSFTLIGTGGLSAIGSWFILDEITMSDPVAVKEIPKEGIGNVYPNPASNVINIPFYQSAKEAVTISIYDEQGKLVRNLVKEEFAKGQCKLVESVSDLANGTYMCILRSGDKVQTTTFKIAR